VKNIFTKKALITGLLLSATAALVLSTSVLAATDYGTSSKGSTFPVADANFRLSGSTTCFPILSAALSSTPGTSGRQAGGSFQASGYSSVIADLEQGGSGFGVQDVVDEAVDVGLSSSNTKILAGTTAYAFARDGICMIVNSSVATNDISMTQIKNIYNGSDVTWDQDSLGGTGTIVPLGRTANSGTWSSVNDFTGTTQSALTVAHQYDSNAALVAAVIATPNSIGYCGMGYTDSLPSSVKVLTLAGTAPTQQNVYSGVYGMSRYLWLLFKTTPTSTTVQNNRTTATALKDYFMTRAGQNIDFAQGFVKYYVDQDVNHDGKISIGDVSKVGLAWGQTGTPGWTNEDVNQDGKISIGDVSKIGLWWGMVASNYGNTMTGNVLTK
jgi:phosphate transport system substrate-binding protein